VFKRKFHFFNEQHHPGEHNFKFTNAGKDLALEAIQSPTGPSNLEILIIHNKNWILCAL
jgi:hypothetical protein